MEPSFEKNLAAVIARRFEGTKLTSVNQLTAGASQQTFRLTVEEACGKTSVYAFRRAQPGLESSSYGQLPPSLEVDFLWKVCGEFLMFFSHSNFRYLFVAHSA